MKKPMKPTSKPHVKSHNKSKKPVAPALPLFPMRINKFLAHNGYSTRRGADEIIAKRWVTINGKVAVLGDKVIETDNVEVRNNKKAEDYVYYAFNKPKGVSSEKAVASRDFFPVLPLDAQAEGLMIVTNDRRLIDRLANPEHKHIKEYTIKTVQSLRPNFKEKMEEAGIGTVHIKTEKNYSLRVTDIGNRIREMSSKFFADIESLKRTKILNIELGGIQVNDRREIKDEELAQLLKSLGL